MPSHVWDLVLVPLCSPQPLRSLHLWAKYLLAQPGNLLAAWLLEARGLSAHPSAEMLPCLAAVEPGQDAGLSCEKPQALSTLIPRKAITVQQITGLIKSHYAISESKSDLGAAD